MARDNSTIILAGPEEGLLTQKQFMYGRFVLKFCLNPALSVCVLSTNIVNMVVFYKMGLKDGVTQNFFILSLSDGTWGLLALAYNVSYIMWQSNARGGRLSTMTVAMVTSAGVNLPMNVSMVTTVVIAVVRCCCVAMPLQVKHVITARRQLVVIAVCVAFMTGAFIYVALAYKIVWRHNPHVNRSQFMLEFTEDILVRISFNDIYRGILFNTSMCVTVVCIVILVISLRQSSRFQTQASVSSDTEVNQKRTAGFSNRDRQVVKTVAVVLVMFTLGNVPSVLWSVLRQVVPGFRVMGRYERSNELFYMFSETMGVLNAGTNMFVYYFYNTRFRTAFLAVFQRKE
ncbi:chemosensory receptor A [Elysia marginata]|uniref:Chemosensory receptor A n=1 Tax=Elysia marginata TaxID=1093978 RepID=A0AAV4GHU8_9GAST|nr:chemosensory receptor A [Elysia marginata]